MMFSTDSFNKDHPFFRDTPPMVWHASQEQTIREELSLQCLLRILSDRLLTYASPPYFPQAPKASEILL
jgi:hypothetical protein